ncbi:MAG: hypothetical protein D6706_15720 [Chloroflexi bacterium]|nr:MAG: hypothetical protein D6706_15720 [Chloroflexota bacterium]
MFFVRLVKLAYWGVMWLFLGAGKNGVGSNGAWLLWDGVVAGVGVRLYGRFQVLLVVIGLSSIGSKLSCTINW